MALELIETDYNAQGVVNNYYYDADRDSIVVNTNYNASALLDQNTKARNDSSNGFTKSGDMRKIADIDMVTVHRLLVEFNIDVNKQEDMPRLKAWLRDRDNRAFTTVRAGSF